MRISITVKSNVNAAKYKQQIENDDAFWTFAATEWHRLYAPYTPYKTGTLDNTVSISPKQIKHTVPYAKYQYYGNFRHTLTYHPKASARWDEAAEPTQKPALISSMQAYIKSGRLKLK